MGIAEAVQTSVTIAHNAALSGAAYIGTAEIVGVSVPTIDNAKLTFQGSADGTTYRNLYDSTPAELEWAASTGAYFATLPANLKGVNYLKIRSGTAGAPVNQTTAAVTIVLVLK